MKKRQTIFQKYLWLSMIAVFLGFTILGVMIVYFVTQYWEADRWESLQSYATTVSLTITDKAVMENDKATFPQTYSDVIRDTMRTLSGGLHADIIVTDNQGKMTFCSENAVGIDSSTVVEEEIFRKAMRGELREVSDFGGIYDGNYYIVGVPVQILTGDGHTTLRAIFVTNTAEH